MESGFHGAWLPTGFRFDDALHFGFEACDDTDFGVNPAATDTPYDGIDSNCNDDDDT